jgi:RES domain-containing protein
LRPRTWDGTAYWQGDPEPFDHAALVSTAPNRWNDGGTAAVYLAGDVGLALVEAGRHLAEEPGSATTRAIWRAEIRAPGIVDLRGAVHARPGARDGLWLLDRARCRRAAAELLLDQGVMGLVVPSVGSLDDPSRWNLVLFVERLTVPLGDVVHEAAVIGRLHIGGLREGHARCPRTRPPRISPSFAQRGGLVIDA